MKALKGKNRRLERMYAEMSMQAKLLKEALEEKMTRPSTHRKMAEKAVVLDGVIIALTCCTFGVSGTYCRYSAKLNEENEQIVDLLIRLRRAKKTCRFGLCFLYLRNVRGPRWNHKRVYRIYRELELNIRIKRRRRLERDKPDVMTVPEAPNLVLLHGFHRRSIETDGNSGC